MGMSRLRNIEASLYYYIFDLLSIKNDPNDATLLPLSTTNFKFPKGEINFFKPIAVYVDGILAQNYVINYNEGTVIFNNPLSTDVVCTADYYYTPVKVLTAFPDMLNEVVILPSVAIEYDESSYMPVELGTSTKKEARHQFTFGVFAGSGAEKLDISDKLIENMFDKTIPLIDFNIAFPLTADGFLNVSFNKEKQTIGFLDFEEVVQRSFRTEKYGDIELNVMLIDAVVVDYIL
jgi:hypothetical protein